MNDDTEYYDDYPNSSCSKLNNPISLFSVVFLGSIVCVGLALVLY